MRKIGRRRVAFAAAASIVVLLVTGSVSGWFAPQLRNPTGTYVGSVPGPVGPSGNPPGDSYYTFVFHADRRAWPRHMTMLMYWNTYQMYDPRAESRSLYVGECVRFDKNTWKFRMVGYLRGFHPEDVWVANDLVWMIDDSGTFTFSDDYMEVTMVYDQGWYTPGQDTDKDGFSEGEPNGGYWPGTIVAKRVTVT